MISLLPISYTNSPLYQTCSFNIVQTMAQIKKQSQPSSPQCPPPHPHIKRLWTLPLARLGPAGGRELIPPPLRLVRRPSTLSCKRGQAPPPNSQNQGKLLSVGCKPTSFAAREENDHQVRARCVCDGDRGRGRAGSWPYHVQRLRMKSAWGQETGGKPQSSIRSIWRRKEEMLSPVSGTDLRHTLTCSLRLWVSCTDPGQPRRGRALGLQVTPSVELSQEASPAQPSPSR